MQHPQFFNSIEKIVLQDSLLDFLGLFEDGVVEISYLDVVKNAGHSCPTVLGAYLCVLEGLKVLYRGSLPQRGDIKVEFKESENDGVAGVIANVVGHITGATKDSGFKGLAGRFDRCNLVDFNCDIDSSMRLSELTNGSSVDVYYNPNAIMPNSKMGELMQKCIAKMASKEEQKLFGALWQERVKNIYEHRFSVIEVVSV